MLLPSVLNGVHKPLSHTDLYTMGILSNVETSVSEFQKGFIALHGVSAACGKAV